ncbi:MAG: hypothetical protein HOP29_15785 [Phycisphaerales bacterium]|nr:hypothetical protein [Phycisphaerales bacterium]
MDSINNVKSSNVNSVPGPQRKTIGEESDGGRFGPSRSASAGDSAVFSSASLQLARTDDLTNIRAGLIDRVRAEIAGGRYDTDERIDATVDRVLADISRVDLHV